uniref:Uncharacterized protein n=1 Tax=viral metagenome TaxID=1070528 RepID=A0A8J9WUU0_9ZZZZ
MIPETDNEVSAENTTAPITEPASKRDYVREGEIIQQRLVPKVREKPMPLQIKPPSTWIPNNFNVKRRPLNKIQTYVPSFFHLLAAANRVYSAIKEDRTLKRDDTIDAASFLYYIATAAFYTYLKSVVTHLGPNHEVQQLVNVYEKHGVQNIRVPTVLQSWFDAIGQYEYKPHETTFKPTIPFVDYGEEDNLNALSQGFYSAQTAHLLPNFRLILAKGYYFSGQIVATRADPKTEVQFMTKVDLQIPPIVTTACTTRANLHLIPGLSNLYVTKEPKVLTSIVKSCSLVELESNICDYAFAFPDLLSHAVDVSATIGQQVSTFPIKDIHINGDHSIMLPAVSLQHTTASELFSCITPNPKAKKLTDDIIARVKSLRERSLYYEIQSADSITNGLMITCSSIPLMWIPLSDQSPLSIIIANPNQTFWHSITRQYSSPSLYHSEVLSCISRTIPNSL